jgi:UDP-glucose 4-epimerase
MTPDDVGPARVLVTGANGRLGRRLVAALQEKPEYEVVAVGGTSASADQPCSRIDLADFDDLDRVVQDVRPDAIVHLAGIVGARCDDDPAAAERVNVQGTRILAQALARRSKTRFIFASTAAVYGDAVSGPLSESAADAPSSVYGRQKLRAEHVLAGVADASAGALTVVALRIFNVFGPGFDASLVERLRLSTPSRPVELRAIDEFVRDYVHVDDVVDAIARALSVELTAAISVINVGSGVGVTSRQLVESLSRVSPVYYSEEPGRPSSSVADIRRARALLGFDPRTSVSPE